MNNTKTLPALLAVAILAAVAAPTTAPAQCSLRAFAGNSIAQPHAGAAATGVVTATLRKQTSRRMRRPANAAEGLNVSLDRWRSAQRSDALLRRRSRPAFGDGRDWQSVADDRGHAQSLSDRSVPQIP